MTSVLADVQTQYAKSDKLKPSDVQALLDWATKQPHLPEITELQAILFLHSCNYSGELAKTTIDTFFTCRTHFPEVFQNQDASSNSLSPIIQHNIITSLPKKTPQDYTIFFIKLDSNSDNFQLIPMLQYYDMVAMLDLYHKGTRDGHVVVVDLEGMHLGHLVKMGPLVLKKFMYYFQEGMPIVLRQLHFLHVSSVMDRLLSMLRPLLKDDILQMMELHTSVDGLTKSVPLECLPEEYGGSVETLEVLHEKTKRSLEDNLGFFQWEESFGVDESKRVGKLRQDDLFGIDGTFRKLEID